MAAERRPPSRPAAWSAEFTAPNAPGEHAFRAMCPPRPGGPPITEPTTTTMSTTTVPVDPPAPLEVAQPDYTG